MLYTSVIIDGRIADICDTGIIDARLVEPRFVLQENALGKRIALPGEPLTETFVKQADPFGQGVGYFDDGTMVLARGRAAIGQKIIIPVTSVVQTPAGRMIFGKIDKPGTAAGTGVQRKAVTRQ